MRRFGTALIIGVASVSASGVQAQDQPPPPARDTQLVYDREVFAYPAFTRRNPFAALGGANAGGPRFEQLSLIGLMYSSDATASVAPLRVPARNVQVVREEAMLSSWKASA